MRNANPALSTLTVLAFMALAAPAALGGAHTWDVVEIFSDSTGIHRR